jgi:predicted AAA+ superfamily ATPase
MAQALESLIEHAEAVLQRLEKILPPSRKKTGIAFRWRGLGRPERLRPIVHPKTLSMADIPCWNI